MYKFFSVALGAFAILFLILIAPLWLVPESLARALENQNVDFGAFLGAAVWISGAFALSGMTDVHPSRLAVHLAVWLIFFGYGVCTFLNLPIIQEVSFNTHRLMVTIGLIGNSVSMIVGALNFSSEADREDRPAAT